MIDDARRTSFDRDARGYDAVRPSYPEALVDAVLAATAPDPRALEIGAGTGKATVPFARRGLRIDALEPGANLAAVLRERVAAFPRVTIAETTFEAWADADGAYDLVYAAQSIHWIDPAVRYPKIARTLRAGGTVAILRNEKSPLDPAVRAELDAAYARSPIPAAAPESLDAIVADVTADLDASGCFGPVTVTRVAWPQRHTTADYLALLSTYSDHAVLAAPARAALFDDLARALDARGGITIPYVSLAFTAQRSVS